MEEEKDLLSLHLNKSFDFYDIEWVIDNFYLATCRANWIIQSPEFTARGSQTTKWFLILKPTTTVESDPISLVLKRSEIDIGPEIIWVNWRLQVSEIEAHKSDFTDRLWCFKKGSECSENLKTLEYFLVMMKPFERDFFTVRCKIIIYSEDICKEFKPCSDIGIKLLSEKLLKLCGSEENHDLQLKINDKIIPAHKVIVCARNDKLNRLLGELDKRTKRNVLEEIDVIDLSYLDYEGMMKVLKYLYSGDLKYVLSKPSLAIYDCASILGIREVNEYYTPNSLIFRTPVKIEELKFTWVICEESPPLDVPVISPVFTDAFSGTTWKLHLYPRREESTDYFALFAESTEEMKQIDLCLEFAVVDETERCLFSKRLRSPAEGLKEFGFKKFIRRNVVNSFLTDGDLRLVMRLRLSTGTKSSYIEKNSISFIGSDFEEMSFLKLSIDMRDIYNSRNFWDTSLVSKGIGFRVHKCIMVSRSSFFSSLLSDKDRGDKTLDLSNIKPNVLNLLLNYIYSGSVLELEDKKTSAELHKAAVYCKLPVFKYVYASSLQAGLGSNETCLKLQDKI